MKINITSIILVTLVVVAGAYWFFFIQTSNQPPLTTSSAVESASQVRFQTLVASLQNIKFNSSILSDPKFTALVDITTPVTPEPSGRVDPFAPVPGVAGL